MLICDRMYQNQAEVGMCETTTSQSEYHKDSEILKMKNIFKISQNTLM